MSRPVNQRRFFALLPTLWLIMLALVMAFAVQASAITPTPATSVRIDDEIDQMVATTGQARILLLLGESGSPITATATEPAAVATLQKRFLQTVTPADFQLYRQYQFVPGLAGTVTAAGLEKLRTNPLVRALQLDHPGGAQLQESLPALGGDVVHNTYGITGRGVTVAVIDSGIDTDHPDLADDLVAQHCFTNSACPPGNLSQSSSAEDENGHGTHVAGVITANGIVSGRGFAPGAKLVAVRVLDKFGSGYVSDWISGSLLLAWATPGVKLITVTLENVAGRITATHAVTVQWVAPLTVTLDAPLTTAVGLSTTVRAQVQPTNGSLPLIYTWQATDQLPLTRTTEFSDTVVYRWSTPGLKTITVQAQNRAGMVANQRRIVVIDDRRLYLPLIKRP